MGAPIRAATCRPLAAEFAETIPGEITKAGSVARLRQLSWNRRYARDSVVHGPNGSSSFQFTPPAETIRGRISESVVVYPTPLASITQTLQAFLQQPYGCFEQTSSTMVAAVPGRYTGPASGEYLYYTDEFKNWAPGLSVTITAREFALQANR